MWHGATIGTYFNLRPVNLLYYEVIKTACKKGYIWFDFNPSAGLEGVKAFKERFGAQALKCPIVKLRPRTIRAFAIEKVESMLIEIHKKGKFKNLSQVVRPALNEFLKNA
jgi:lipid II:glycine glycyltransferase (peptidoglycan interpeptide bridge formation enzyme)